MTIELKNLGKIYDGKDKVLSNISANIQDQEFFAIVGPSGSGKSTLLRMIAGILSIDEGELIMDNKKINNVAPKDRKISMVFQSYALYPFLSVEDNIGFGLKSRKVPKDEIKKRVNNALSTVQLTKLRKRRPKSLSGGQRQRVALARAIASNAKVCLMDEPLSNLDAQLRAQMRTEIRNLQRKLGLTVIYVTHDQLEAMTMADHVMILNHQHVQQIGTPMELYHSPINEFVAKFFGNPQINLFQTTHNENKLIISNDFSLYSNQPLDSNKDYVVGIRPNEIAIKPNSVNANTRVQQVSYLGDRTLVIAELNDGQALKVITDNRINIKIDDLIQITKVDQYYIFDAQTKKLENIAGFKGDVNYA